MRTSFLLTAVLLALGSAACAQAQNLSPQIRPNLVCPPGTAPNLTQIGGGGITLPKIGLTVNLPGYTSFNCPPVHTSTPKPSPAPTPSPKPTPKPKK